MGQLCIRANKSEISLDDVNKSNKCSQNEKRFRWLGSSLFGHDKSKTSSEERENEGKSCTDDSNSEASEGCAADVKAVQINTVSSTEEQDEQEDGASADYYSCDSVIVSVETDKALDEDVRPRIGILGRFKLHKRKPKDEKQEKKDFKSSYKLGRLLGKGRSGSVFKGVRRSDSLKVAVKIVTKTERTQYLNISDHADSLPKEIALMTLVSKEHDVPQLIKLLDWYDEPQRYILILERPQACVDLHKFLYDCGGRMKEESARHVMQQVTQAAIACSKRGVMHLDIKLQNLLVTPETGMVKLIDFGAGELLKDSPYRSYGGTKICCPPEFLVRNEFHGDKATVWSLGVLLYRMVHGHYPNSHTQQDINNNVWTKTDLSEECCHLIHCCLQQEPQKRIKLKQILRHKWFKEEEGQQEQRVLNVQVCSSPDSQTGEPLSLKKTETEGNEKESGASQAEEGVCVVRPRIGILGRFKLHKREPEDEKQKKKDFKSSYKLGRLLSKGRSGSVFKGVRRSDSLKVAVKIVTKTERTQYLNIPNHADSLPKEIALMTLVSKGPDVPQLIKLLDWYDEPERYILILERPWHCVDLHKFLYDCGGRMKEESARHVMQQVTQAAIACSKRGVMHLDIKLQNLLVTPETGMVKLIDFGAGELLKDSPYRSYGGTKICCPPEFSVRNEFHGDKATVWSLGVLLYRMVRGHYPYYYTQQDINNNVWTKTDLSEECCHLIHCCMQQEPQKRIKLKQILRHKWFKENAA